jgi:hypothetical protein
MKKLTKFLLINVTIIILAGCVSKSSQEKTESLPTSNVEESHRDDTTNSSTVEPSKTNSSSSEGRELSGDDREEEEPLSEYSNEQIEYARVWLQLGPNQEIDHLYVHHIPAGTPLNPDDETSVSYPEDVIQLAGSRLVDGSVTYSGNGDGTINIYNVPLRWDGQYPAGESFYTNLIKNTALVYINPSVDEDIVKIIRKQSIN